MKRGHLVVFVTLFLLLGIPAYAYGAPSGGALFQILMPMLAAIWGMWMIFANNLRRRARSLLQKMRGTQPSEPGDS